MRSEGKSFGRGKRPVPRQAGTLAGAAIATWVAFGATVWLISYTIGCF